jgi:hypothetical protein
MRSFFQRVHRLGICRPHTSTSVATAEQYVVAWFTPAVGNGVAVNGAACSRHEALHSPISDCPSARVDAGSARRSIIVRSRLHRYVCEQDKISPAAQ